MNERLALAKLQPGCCMGSAFHVHGHAACTAGSDQAKVTGGAGGEATFGIVIT